MDESTLWGLAGLALALAAVAVMFLDQHFIGALTGGDFADPLVWYGLVVVAVAVVTVAIVGHGVVRDR